MKSKISLSFVSFALVSIQLVCLLLVFHHSISVTCAHEHTKLFHKLRYEYFTCSRIYFLLQYYYYLRQLHLKVKVNEKRTFRTVILDQSSMSIWQWLVVKELRLAFYQELNQPLVINEDIEKGSMHSLCYGNNRFSTYLFSLCPVIPTF